MNPSGASTVIAASSADVYYNKGYWNDYPSVVAEINRRITGDAERGYVDAFVERIGERRFARGLFLNCGSGWVERELYARGIVDNIVGIDYSEELLEGARRDAAGLPFRYERCDINQAVFPDDRYDLIVNYSAGHHIAFLDRVLRSLAHHLTDDGWFLNYDYVGPHRNQYPYEQWSAAWELNRRLPEEARQKLSYPHLPTMLVTDPSEAIHSELFRQTFARYFDVVDYRPIGGALAYPLLTFNEQLSALEPARREEIIATVMRADGRFLAENPALVMFAYWCGTVRRGVLSDAPLLDRWTREEDAREEAAAHSGGRYYPPTLLQALVYPELAQ